MMFDISKKNKIYFVLLFITLISTLSGIIDPLLGNDDPVLYASIAKHIALSNDYIDLVVYNKEWLDKPHFQFWIIGLAFKIFGFSSVSYMLTGFAFHVLGVIYTYKIAKYLYNHEVGMISAIICANSLHLINSSVIDLRAEAFLIGTIMPACYYLLMYDKYGKVKNLLLGCFCCACAMMTKGVFVVITIYSGLVVMWILAKQYRKIISFKWLLAYCLSLLFILPEVLSLYLQFDIHPEKIIFDRTHVSGIEWYFWGSQFGRFFNNGHIIRSSGSIFYFIHTFLWAFLPWSILFVFSIIDIIKNKLAYKIDKDKTNYLLASFFVSFIIFSISKFQLDHYINIILPFSAIIVANYLYNLRSLLVVKYVQLMLYLAINILIIIAWSILFYNSVYLFGIIFPIVIIAVLWKMFYKKSITISQILAGAVLSIACLYYGIIFVIFIDGTKIDVGYNVARYINSQNYKKTVYDMTQNSDTLNLYLTSGYTREIGIREWNMYKVPKENYYIFIKQKELGNLNLGFYPYKIAYQYCGSDSWLDFLKTRSMNACYLLLER